MHVTELLDVPPQKLGEGQLPVYAFEEQHLCESCAAKNGVPFTQIKKTQLEIWKLLHATAQRQKRESSLACPDCGMTLAEFREKGRLGCPRDYEIFREHLDRLLERVHNSDHHVGRLPGGRVQPPRVESVAKVGHEDAAEDASVQSVVEGAQQGAQSALEEIVQAGNVHQREQLSAELERAVREEDYERAAQLRDELRELDA